MNRITRVVAAATLCAGLAPAAASALEIMQQRIVDAEILQLSSSQIVPIADFSRFSGPGTLTGVSLAWDVAAGGAVVADFCREIGDCEPGTFILELVGTTAFAVVSDSDADSTGFTSLTDDTQTSFIDTRITGMQVLANLGDFEGVGFVSQLSLSIIRDGYMAFPGESPISGTLTLTYEYTVEETSPVPLPAAGALLLAGAAGLGLMGRRRRRT